jgi:hypothetical protein
MRPISSLALVPLVAALAACVTDEPPTGTNGAASPSAAVLNAAPPREDPWRSTTSESLWQHIVRYDSTVTVGIKHPGAARGVVDGRWLVEKGEWRNAVAALGGMPGVQTVQQDALQPMVRLRVADADAIERIRRMPYVDYIEPAVLDGAVGDRNPPLLASGSQGSLLNSSSSTGDPNYGYYVDAEGNWIPRIFTGMRIPEAWALSTGAGFKLGFLDTGVDWSNPELAGWRGYRVYYSDTYDDEKPHGTHVAGAIGAPRNGTHVVGVAYGITPINVKHSNNYVDVNTWRVIAALDTAVTYGGPVLQRRTVGRHPLRRCVRSRVGQWRDGSGVLDRRDLSREPSKGDRRLGHQLRHRRSVHESTVRA